MEPKSPEISSQLPKPETPKFNLKEPLKNLLGKVYRPFFKQKVETNTQTEDEKSDPILKASTELSNVWKEGNGYVVQVYHGTGNEFKKFDLKYADKTAFYGPGGYFTESPELAQTYATTERGSKPNVVATILHIKKPFDTRKQFTTGEIEQLNLELPKSKDLSTSLSPRERTGTGRWAYNQLLKKLGFGNNEGKSDIEAKIRTTEYLKKLGYDAIVYTGGQEVGDIPHTVWVMLNAKGIELKTHPNTLKKITSSIELGKQVFPQIQIDDNIDNTTKAKLYETLLRLTKFELPFFKIKEIKIGDEESNNGDVIIFNNQKGITPSKLLSLIGKHFYNSDQKLQQSYLKWDSTTMTSFLSERPAIPSDKADIFSEYFAEYILHPMPEEYRQNRSIKKTELFDKYFPRKIKTDTMESQVENAATKTEPLKATPISS